MTCKKGMSICEICGKSFSWIRHESQKSAQFCSKYCRGKKFGVIGNKNRIFWPIASLELKQERIRSFFEKKVIKKEGCWGWKGSLDKNGYPQLYAGNTKAKGHRISYKIHKGNIPEGMIVCHSCDNPSCTNPDHLCLGTKKENDLDRTKKGRSAKGEKCHFSKLSEKDVLLIKNKLTIGITMKKIAREYSVHPQSIFNIKHGKTWKHVKES